MIITEKHLQILRHSLGIDYLPWYERHKIDAGPYRNHFATSEDASEYPLIVELIAEDLMRGPFTKIGVQYFTVTNEGIALARKSAHEYAKKTKPSRSKARYLAYLHSETDESFIAWLKNPYWDDYRKQYTV